MISVRNSTTPSMHFGLLNIKRETKEGYVNVSL